MIREERLTVVGPAEPGEPLADYIRRVVATAPPLLPEDADRLRALLPAALDVTVELRQAA